MKRQESNQPHKSTFLPFKPKYEAVPVLTRLICSISGPKSHSELKNLNKYINVTFLYGNNADSFVAIFAVFSAVKHVTKAPLCFISSELWNHGNRGCWDRELIWIMYCPWVSLLFLIIPNYRCLACHKASCLTPLQNTSLLPSGGSLLPPSAHKGYCLLRPAIGKLLMDGR